MSSNKFNQEIISKTEKTFFQKLVSEQSFWVSIALLGICFMMFFELKTDLKESLKKDQK